MQEWVDAILSVNWLLGFSMALAFKRLAEAVGRRAANTISPEDSSD